jgi:ribosomal protein RSM22 (predicted rRNA methylase)
MFGRFPEHAALYMNPFKVDREMKNIHPMSPERRPAEAARALAASSKLVERSDDKTAVAFASTSLPARYATVIRILEELKFRDKRWHPATVLDYFSGPGCGMWATMQVLHSVPVFGFLRACMHACDSRVSNTAPLSG